MVVRGVCVEAGVRVVGWVEDGIRVVERVAVVVYTELPVLHVHSEVP